MKLVSFITKSIPDAFLLFKERTGQKLVVVINEWDFIICDGAITENI